MFGKGSVKSSEMNAHKAMAGGESKGNFGVGKFPGRTASSGGARTDTLPDSARGPGLGGKGVNMQAAPDHGSYGADHFNRNGKA